MAGKFDDPLIERGIMPINDGLSLEESDAKEAACHKLMFEMQDALTSVNIQIEDAKASAIEAGEYADPGWWASVKAAKHIKGRQHQSCQMALRIIGNRVKRAPGNFRQEIYRRR